MIIYTKNNLIDELQEICNRGWIESVRRGNHGSVGNTLEDLLGIEENNLPIPNANEWELKTHRIKSNALITLFHVEPSPRAIGFVPNIFLTKYGWPHRSAGSNYPPSEMSFRQTINGNSHSDRGFKVVLDRENSKVLVSFDYTKVSDRHNEWLTNVEKIIGLDEINPQPYWGFQDLENKAGTKLLNCFYVQAEVKRYNGKEFYRYCSVTMLEQFSFDYFLDEIQNGNILIDFDARTGHNHGSKFRLRSNSFPKFYDKVALIIV